jgi:LuxR family maltose regulon positive regulatory protein
MRRPGLGVFARQDLRAELSHARGSFVLGASALTAAGLRLLPMLSTRLSFPEVAGEMFLSRHTVKSQAAPVHRKLRGCSRSQAVARPRNLGFCQQACARLGWEVPGCSIGAGLCAWPCITGQVWAVDGGRGL